MYLTDKKINLRLLVLNEKKIVNKLRLIFKLNKCIDVNIIKIICSFLYNIYEEDKLKYYVLNNILIKSEIINYQDDEIELHRTNYNNGYIVSNTKYLTKERWVDFVDDRDDINFYLYHFY